MGMLSGRIWRDHRFGTAFGKPIAQASGVVGTICDQARRARQQSQQSSSAIEIVSIAGGELEAERPPSIIRQCVDLRRAAAARAPDGVVEGPPFAPAAERWALMCVESIAAVPTMPVDPVNA